MTFVIARKGSSISPRFGDHSRLVRCHWLLPKQTGVIQTQDDVAPAYRSNLESGNVCDHDRTFTSIGIQRQKI